MRSLKESMSDFLDVLANDTRETIDSGYYQNVKAIKKHQTSLTKAIIDCELNPVIAEIKGSSPSAGTIRNTINPKVVAKAMQKGCAVALSVLTEPKHFKGSLKTLSEARETVELPILMKDIIITTEQIDVASRLGANAVLLIQSLFEKDYCEISVAKMIDFAHIRGLEVLLETHTEEEFKFAIETKADLVGINNRNLGTLKIDLNTTKEILRRNANWGKIIVSESGIKNPRDLRFLRECGAKAFLIGSSIMLSKNIEDKVKEFVEA